MMNGSPEKLLARSSAVEDFFDLRAEQQRDRIHRDPLLYGRGGGDVNALGISERERSNQPLHNSQDALAEIIASAMDAIITVDADQRIILFNASAEKMFGCPAEKVLGQSLDCLIPAEFRQAHREHIRRFCRTNVTKREIGDLGVVYGVRANGEKFPLEAAISQSEVGGQKHFTAILRDITEIKRAEAEMQQSEANYRAIFDAANDAIFVHDLETGAILDANQRMGEMYGCDPAHITNLSIADFSAGIPPYTQEDALQWVRKAIAGEPQLFEWLAKDQHGRLFWVEINLKRSIISGHDRLLAIVRDITERKQAEQAKFSLAAIVETTDDAIISQTLDSVITSWNAGAEKIFGYTAEEAIGRPILMLIPLDHQAEEPQIIENIKRGERIVHYEAVRVRKDGRRIDVALTISPIKGEDGRIIGVSKIARDITEHKLIEAEMRQGHAQLEAVFQAVADGIAVSDMAGNFILMNEAQARINGYPSVKVMLKDVDYYASVYELRELDGQVVPVEAWPISKVMRGESVVNWELQARRKDTGQEWIFSFSGEPVRDAQGRQILAVVITRDITRRKRTEHALHESNARNTAMLKAIPDMMFLQSTDGVYLDYHVRDPRDCFMPPEESLGKGMREVLPPELASQFERCFEETRRTNQPSLLEYSLPGQGEPRQFEARLTACNGNKILSIVRDITERRRMEEELRQSLLEVRRLKDQLQAENVYLQEEVQIAQDFGQIIGSGGSLKSVLTQAEQVARTDSTVLITGETGTGKELIAHAIHSLSQRRDRPLVKVNCAALPATLIESELFGHEKGAFTGANAKRVGRFELAQGGTIFLDEVGELPLELQSKLLRVLQDNEFERLGSSRTIKVDVRVLTATNRELEEAVRTGKFRADLYYRLSVFPLHLPPLRERPEDIRPLVDFYVQQFSQKLGKRIAIISTEAVEALERYSWPGNVRELKNVIERAVILSSDGKLQLAESMRVNRAAEVGQVAVNDPQAVKHDLAQGARLEEVEREHILRVMEKTYWRVEGEQGAAKILGVNPGTLRSRLKKLNLRRPPA